MEAKKAVYREAVRVSVPSWFGMGAWGLVTGVAMMKVGLTLPQALGMSLLVYAGSAQLAALPLIAAHAPLWVIFLTALTVNLRFIIFSAILAPHFAQLSWLRRAWYGFLSGDITIGFFSQRYPLVSEGEHKQAYLKGLIYPNWFVWQGASILGIFLGEQVPTSWGLVFASTLAILCLMLPMIKNFPGLCGVIVSGVMAVLAFNWPYKLGLLLAVIVGMAVAMWIEENDVVPEFARSSADKKDKHD